MQNNDPEGDGKVKKCSPILIKNQGGLPEWRNLNHLLVWRDVLESTSLACQNMSLDLGPIRKQNLRMHTEGT
jgi:hypothetical protein